ncbi:TPA: hypothetical protein N0F65_000245 [Lagenidium giganteum]|uniref:Uncharacterized protein n=1 Tax=Lagenidium giganteum TaxID=4803 RepID=A0AAV2Z9R5_9STRA|nr:TPA: hypothetical protein N0F65_000245 [Lagenidium giganteum]
MSKSGPLPRFQVSKEDQHDYQVLADEILHETLTAYETHMYANDRQVDRNRWKSVRKREQLEVLREREGTEQPERERGGSGHFDMEIGPTASMAANSSMPLMMAVGSMPGTLDDAMYGTFVDDTPSLRVRMSYQHDSMDDCAVVASFKLPTEQDPFQFLGVNWFLRDLPGIPGAVVRRRDFLMLAATGLSTTSRGERIGYYILHSISHSSFPELSRQSIVRGKMSLCLIYRQLDANSVDIFMQVLLDPCGNVMNFLVIQECSHTLMTSGKAVACAHKKKLFWFMRHKHRRLSSSSSTGASTGSENSFEEQSCDACAAPLGEIFSCSGSMCQLYQKIVCSRCCVTKKMTLDATAFEVTQRPMYFCLSCMVLTKKHPAAQIAWHEFQEKQQQRRRRQARLLRSQSESTVSVDSAASKSSSGRRPTARSRFGSTHCA